MGLEGTLDKEPFRLAVIGFANLCDRNELKKHTPLTIIDYTKPSTDKRLTIVDIPGRRLLRISLVAHGKNSGENYATRFSDEPGSLMSSFGFFATAETYYGKHNYTLRLNGLEEEYNGNAVERYIVIHGVWYVSQEFIDEHGRLGRSWGCPALPLETAAEIIDLVKGGSCLFIYVGDPEYLDNSALLDRDRAAKWFLENGGVWSDCDSKSERETGG
ncbi:MAG: murein L,D-transpeptidase catalytic domain family protein [Candidatus Latescibacterota bacterium]|nr:MAG: murein L,D-transpeptidase catalytic domain family protein [Candidatus Latescibacterota bacterium]